LAVEIEPKVARESVGLVGEIGTRLNRNYLTENLVKHYFPYINENGIIYKKL
jgi:hypothetical protein